MNNMYNTDMNNTVNIPKTESWFVVDTNNQRKGPFSSEQIIQMYNNCVINDDTYIICQGMNQWIQFKNSGLACRVNNGLPEIPLSCVKNTHNWKGIIVKILVIALGIVISLATLSMVSSRNHSYKHDYIRDSLTESSYNYNSYNSKDNNIKDDTDDDSRTLNEIIEYKDTDESDFDDTDETIEHTETDKSEDTETIKYEKVDIQYLFDELENNAYRAEQTYQDKYVEITGYIDSFDSDGKYFSVIATKDSWTFDSILCDFTNDKQKEIILSKNKGDIVTVRGKITSIGEILGYCIDIVELE